MSILTRYILKAHIPPFFFGLSLLTAVIFVNAVAKRIENELAGKGLSLNVIMEVLALSLPHVIALTLPMAVLVAVLYAFSSLAADNEIAALKGSGVNLLRLLAPPLVAATLLCAAMVQFNDTILPDTNHRLAGLIQDINRKSPTLALREQVLNEIKAGDFGASTYYLKAGRIEPGTNRLWDVVIYDLADPSRRRTIYADSGKMAFNTELTDLFLTLQDGVMYESDRSTPQRFQRADFQRQLVRIAGVGNQFERQEDRSFKSDREMDFSELAEQVADARSEHDVTRDQAIRVAHASLRAALAGSVALDTGSGVGDRERGAVFAPPTAASAPPAGSGATRPAAEAAVPADAGAEGSSARPPGVSVSLRGDERPIRVEADLPGPADASETGPTRFLRGRDLARAGMARAVAGRGPGDGPAGGEEGSQAADGQGAQAGSGQATQARGAEAIPFPSTPAPAAPSGPPPAGRRLARPTTAADQVVRESSSRLMQWASVADTHDARVRQYEVEFWKKLAIPAACIVFVLIGAPIGIRFPRGGVGMVILVSLAVFAVYYAGLIGGESLADDGILTPFWAMWSANLIFLIIGLWAVTTIGRESATSRGGGWDDLLHACKRLLTSPLRLFRRRERAA